MIMDIGRIELVEENQYLNQDLIVRQRGNRGLLYLQIALWFLRPSCDVVEIHAHLKFKSTMIISYIPFVGKSFLCTSPARIRARNILAPICQESAPHFTLLIQQLAGLNAWHQGRNSHFRR
jgi:hypothetical protein